MSREREIGPVETIVRGAAALGIGVSAATPAIESLQQIDQEVANEYRKAKEGETSQVLEISHIDQAFEGTTITVEQHFDQKQEQNIEPNKDPFLKPTPTATPKGEVNLRSGPTDKENNVEGSTKNEIIIRAVVYDDQGRPWGQTIDGKYVAGWVLQDFDATQFVDLNSENPVLTLPITIDGVEVPLKDVTEVNVTQMARGLQTLLDAGLPADVILNSVAQLDDNNVIFASTKSVDVNPETSLITVTRVTVDGEDYDKFAFLPPTQFYPESYFDIEKIENGTVPLEDASGNLIAIVNYEGAAEDINVKPDFITPNVLFIQGEGEMPEDYTIIGEKLVTKEGTQYDIQVNQNGRLFIDLSAPIVNIQIDYASMSQAELSTVIENISKYPLDTSEIKGAVFTPFTGVSDGLMYIRQPILTGNVSIREYNGENGFHEDEAIFLEMLYKNDRNQIIRGEILIGAIGTNVGASKHWFSQYGDKAPYPTDAEEFIEVYKRSITQPTQLPVYVQSEWAGDAKNGCAFETSCELMQDAFYKQSDTFWVSSGIMTPASLKN